MAIYRPSFTCSSPRCDVESLRPPVEQSDESHKDDGDPQKLVQCPFDKNHKIRACRFPFHIIKCRKNHPKLASELKTCPFNARHLMPRQELSGHVANCVDRQNIKADTLDSTDIQKKWNVLPSAGGNLSCTEDWDQEADNNKMPFIWGMSTSVLSSSLEVGTSDYLTSARRAPRTLPWNNCVGRVMDRQALQPGADVNVQEWVCAATSHPFQKREAEEECNTQFLQTSV